MQLVLTIISWIDLVIVIIFDALGGTNTFFVYPWLTAFIRPVLVTVLVRNIRSFWKRYILVIKGSMPMVLFILVYVMYFSWMGKRLYSGTIEGVENFSSFNDAFFYMFVLLTTSNFPDIMLPAYRQNRKDCVFFIFYLVVGLFLLMNLLLAIFYSNYQERADEGIDNFEETRSTFIIDMFNSKDIHKKGHLNRRETRELLEEIHTLVVNKDSRKESNM